MDETTPLGILTEPQLRTQLNVTKDQLAHLREQGLPYAQISAYKRLYSVDDIASWVTSKTKRPRLKRRSRLRRSG